MRITEEQHQAFLAGLEALFAELEVPAEDWPEFLREVADHLEGEPGVQAEIEGAVAALLGAWKGDQPLRFYMERLWKAAERVKDRPRAVLKLNDDGTRLHMTLLIPKSVKEICEPKIVGYGDEPVIWKP